MTRKIPSSIKKKGYNYTQKIYKTKYNQSTDFNASNIFMFFKQKFTTEPRIDKIKLSLYRYTSSLLSILKFILLLATISLSPDLYRLKELHISI